MTVLTIIVVAPEQDFTTTTRVVVPVSDVPSLSAASISKVYPAVVLASSVTPVLTVIIPVEDPIAK